MAALRKAESTAAHNYQMLKQSLEDQLSADNKDLAGEKNDKAAAEESKSTAEKDLSVTSAELAAAKSDLETASQNCKQVASDHAESVKAREEELNLIAEAKKILVDSTSGAASLLQVGSASGIRSGVDLARSEIVTQVKELAKKQHSTALSQLASRIATVMRYGSSVGEDPFVKVRGLISDMISKLEEQANSEANEKAYCDEETAKTGAKKSELDATIKKLSSKIDQAAARSSGLKDEVKGLQAELASLAKEQAGMDKMRQESHAEYTAAKAELSEALDGVRKATVLLRDYYGGASFVQAPAAPGQHSKAAGAGQSIIGILEVCEADFAKSLANEEMEESSRATAYEKNTQQNKIMKAQMAQDVKYKTQEHKSLDKTISELSSDRETSATELSAVLEYKDKLDARCIAKPETYEQRKQRREAEIAGLKEALATLENEVALVQHSTRSRHMRGSLRM